MEYSERLQLTADLKAYASEIDIDLIGIAGIDEMNAKSKIGRRPMDIGPEIQSIIVTPIGLLDSLAKSWVSPQDDAVQQSAVALNLLLIRELKLKNYLFKKGYKAYGYSDSRGLFNVSIRAAQAFRLAGLGYIGINNLAISEKYGPRMMISTLLTDAPLIPDQPYIENHCGNCTICSNFCTSGAIMGDGYYNARLCESIVNCTPNEVFFSMTGWHDCDICFRKCPQGEYKWSPEERKGNWWDIVNRNREDQISKASIYLNHNSSK